MGSRYMMCNPQRIFEKLHLKKKELETRQARDLGYNQILLFQKKKEKENNKITFNDILPYSKISVVLNHHQRSFILK